MTTTATTDAGTSKPSDLDVICARGKKPFNHIGNVKFRESIRAHLDDFSRAQCKLDKSVIVTKIITTVRESGDFIRQNTDTEMWYPVSDRVVREKVGQAFRDALDTQYKSSSKSKRRRAKAEAAERNNALKGGDDSSSSLESEGTYIHQKPEVKSSPVKQNETEPKLQNQQEQQEGDDEFDLHVWSLQEYINASEDDEEEEMELSQRASLEQFLPEELPPFPRNRFAMSRNESCAPVLTKSDESLIKAVDYLMEEDPPAMRSNGASRSNDTIRSNRSNDAFRSDEMMVLLERTSLLSIESC